MDGDDPVRSGLAVLEPSFVERTDRGLERGQEAVRVDGELRAYTVAGERRAFRRGACVERGDVESLQRGSARSSDVRREGLLRFPRDPPASIAVVLELVRL